MTFIHIADVHLDMPFVSLKGNKKLIKKKKLEQRFVFQKVINYAIENNTDFLFIAGDIFEHKYVTDDTIQFIISAIKKLKNTKVFITPGNHDPYIKSSPYVTYEWPENVYIFNEEINMYEFGNVDIYGLGFNDFEFSEEDLSRVEVDKTKINILVTHGTLNGSSNKYHDIKASWLKVFDYVALRTCAFAKSR